MNTKRQNIEHKTSSKSSALAKLFLRSRCLIALLVLLAVSSATPLLAQAFYGSIVGTVTDSTGGVVPGATVTVTNVSTAEKHTVQSNSAGEFSVVNLVPAPYRVEVSKDTFKRFVRQGLTVEVGGAARVDAALSPGAVTETVEVTTQTPLLETTSSGMSQVIEGIVVQETPLNGRNIMNMIALAPGVVSQGSTSGGAAMSQHGDHTSNQAWNNYQVGGAIAGEAASFVDGAPTNVLGQNTVGLLVTQDAIQEFSVSSSNANSDFGRYGGGVINMTTKSGGNSLHGTAYEYIRNADFNANDFYSNRNGAARPKYNQNQYGGAITGPIKRDKAFFLFTYEGFDSIIGQPSPSEVPTTNMQNGIFSNPLFGVTATQTTAYTDAPSGCVVDGPATVGNPNPGSWTIANLSTCGDSTSKVLKTFYPPPNTAVSGANYFFTPVLYDKQYQYNGRVDFNVSNKQRIFGRYTYWSINDTGFDTFNSYNGWPTENAYSVNKSQQGVLGDTYTLNPKTILDVRADYLREYYPNLPKNQNVNESQFGAAYGALSPQESIHVIPVFTLTGLHSLTGFTSATTFSQAYYNNYVLAANLIRLVGNHSLKFGFEGRLMDQSGTGTDSQAGGAFTFTTAYSGDEFANFLLGEFTTAAIQTFNRTTSYNYYQAYYATDTWQASHNLTFDLGVRYELPGGIAEKNNKATVLLPSAVDPYTGVTGTLALVNTALYPHRPTVLPKFDLVAPHAGFVFRPVNNSAIRGGYTISYLPPDIQGSGTGLMPFSSPVNSAITSVTNTTVPTSFVANPFAPSYPNGIIQPTGRNNPAFMKTSYVGAGLPIQAIASAIPYQKYGYIQQYNFEFSQEFKGNWLLDIGYAGAKGTHIPGIGTTTTVGQDINELSSQYYSMGTALNSTKTTLPDTNSVTLGQSLRPYPNYLNVTDTADWSAFTNYNSLQAKLTKRFGAAGQILANYTYSKQMGNTDTSIGTAETKATTTTRGGGYGQIQDFNNLRGEYSLLSYNVPNRVVISYVVDLPFGRNKAMGANYSAPVEALISGWNVSGITTFQSGFPLKITEATASPLTTNFGAGILRPNVVPGCAKQGSGSALSRVASSSNPTATWFNTACFAYPTGPNPITYNFGNEPRVDATLSSEGVDNFDFALEKGTHLTEKLDLKFRAEFFNIFNRVQFSPPVVASSNPTTAGNNASGIPNVQTQTSTSQFGQILSQANSPREVQFSLRLTY